jgi:undecaprenyl-diphosphatase
VPALWVALVLGLVEGVTEFLPVSSTGHLILAREAFGFRGEFAESFEVAIQAGAVVAVLGIYRARFAALLRPAAPGRFGGLRGIGLLALATAPFLVVGFLVRHSRRALEAPLPVAAALAAGAVAILAVERLRGDRGTRDVDGLTAATALGVGLFQVLALWPGVSRSAATILGGMLLGLRRGAAAEFSFLAAVPAILAAAGWSLVSGGERIDADSLGFLAAGFAASAVFAALAVKGFVAWLSRAGMEPFAWYRLALAAAVVLALAL